MTKRAIAALVILLAAAGLAAVMIVVRRGISARERPGAIETFIARQMRHWATPSRLRRAKNPLPLTAAELADARAHFADHCAICHGNDGKGQTEMGRAMYPPAPDMTQGDTQALTDGELFSIIENGIRMTGMPAWGGENSEGDSWKLVHFIRHLPKITPQELAEMEALNPKTPAEWKEKEEEKKFLHARP